jgi:chorismate mutase
MQFRVNGINSPIDRAGDRAAADRVSVDAVLVTSRISSPQSLINKAQHKGCRVYYLQNTDELREEIETIDEKIIDLIATRMEIADELAKEKKHSSQEYWDHGKEKEVIERYLKLCEEVSLSEGEAKLIAEVLLRISKDRQKQRYDE